MMLENTRTTLVSIRTSVIETSDAIALSLLFSLSLCLSACLLLYDPDRACLLTHWQQKGQERNKRHYTTLQQNMEEYGVRVWGRPLSRFALAAALQCVWGEGR